MGYSTSITYRLSASVLMAALLMGCQSVYYQTMEKFGYEKRDLLVERVEEAREAQNEAKAQFQSALDQFISVTNFDGGELQEKYEKLKEEFEDSEEKAKAVRTRISKVEQVADDLFDEWRNELTQYSNDSLRSRSKRQLTDTRQRYNKLIAAMRRAETKIDPVLSAFRDQVLFLKHNLNARAIDSLRSDIDAVESDITTLIQEMNASIAEADNFIRSMQGT